jgi:hypothetical protein
MVSAAIVSTLRQFDLIEQLSRLRVIRLQLKRGRYSGVRLDQMAPGQLDLGQENMRCDPFRRTLNRGVQTVHRFSQPAGGCVQVAEKQVHLSSTWIQHNKFFRKFEGGVRIFFQDLDIGQVRDYPGIIRAKVSGPLQTTVRMIDIAGPHITDSQLVPRHCIHRVFITRYVEQ